MNAIGLNATEIVCLSIVIAYVALRARTRGELLRLFFCALLSFAAEDSVIKAYGFYAYNREAWTLFVDQVPIMIVLIWPIVIHSAAALARGRWLVTGAIVLFDAMLIEPIAVHAGLWAWSSPGLFRVPPIGVLGWAFFAATYVRVGVWAVPATHALLVGAWWILFRWVNTPISDAHAVIAAWIASAAFAMSGLEVDPRALLARLPAALFFFVLLGLDQGRTPWLIAYACAFPLPYILLLPHMSHLLSSSKYLRTVFSPPPKTSLGKSSRSPGGLRR